MDFLRELDFWLLQQLLDAARTNVWTALAVYTVAELFIVIPFATLFVLWRKPEPLSHKHGNQKAALMAVLTIMLSLAIKTLVTFLWFRARPFVSHPELDILPLKVDPSSFPSGHTLIVFSIAFSLAFSGLKKTSMWLLILALGVGLARVMSGVHYPSDVVGGMLIALASAWYLHREASSIRKFLPNE